MGRILKEEIRRAFCGTGMKLALALGMAIALAHVLQYGLVNYKVLQSVDYTKVSINHPMPVVEGWMGGNTYNLESFVFFLLLPLLAAIPFGVSYYDEKKHGALHNLLMRVSRRQYHIAKYAATFLSGGTVIVAPLLANLLLTMALLPNHAGTNIMTGSWIYAAKIGYELYLHHPGAYLACYFVLDFLLGGVFACTALVGSYISSYRIINAIFPFFLQLAIYIACTLVGMEGYTSVYFAQAGYGMYTIWVPLEYIAILGGASFLIFLKVGMKNDVY